MNWIENCQNWKLPKLKVPNLESCWSWKWVQHFLLSCQIPKLPNCQVAKLQSCQIAKLQSCQIANLRLQVAKLWTCSHGAKSLFVAKLSNCQVAKLPICQITKLQSCQVAKLQIFDCKLLNCELAIMERNPFRSCFKMKNEITLLDIFVL